MAINPAIVDKLTEMMGIMKVPSDLISQVKDSITKGPVDVAVVKVDSTKEEGETKLTVEQIDKMSEKEAKDALKKEVGCDEGESEDTSYKGNEQEQEMRKKMADPFKM